MKMQIKKNNRTHRDYINRPSPTHGHKYTKYKKCPSMMVLMCVRQHLSNT